ncbi:hypothetical protein ACFSBZ_09040 [Amnibacterium flavum]|uniref:Uncharacterized protein n=1 Tax=Amnibacterium flavum TaxID=2173173 RepID=A0A2V1HQY4_9MICO|nr:hypothetical protein [Amnibacterium flavum]PVZ95013.1 hypothetical protein DDQ50_00280 [Amnibacterium flavum]
MTVPPTSFFALMHDVLAVGPERFCDDLRQLGVDGVTIAASYHASRDLLPRPGGPRLIDLPPGALYFPPDVALYPARTPPWAPAPYDLDDVFDRLRAACTERGMRLTAWTVFGFNERLGRLDTDLVQRTAFGDPLTSDLCPANPVTRAYYRALAADVANHAPDVLLAESLHFQPARLTRRFLDLGAAAKLALSLCFCEHCTEAASDAGADATAASSWARGAIEAAYAGDASDGPVRIPLDEVAGFAGGAVAAYLAVRAATVASLAASVSDALAGTDVALCFMDQAAAEPGLLGSGTVEDVLRYGVDIAGIAAVCGAYQMLGYAPEAQEVASDVSDYQAALGGAADLRVALRPAVPDNADVGNLAAKLRAAIDGGAAGIDFYNYSLVDAGALRRVRDALVELR